MKTTVLTRLLIMVGLAPATSLAQPTEGPLLDWSVGYRAQYQDNIAQLPAEEIDDIISAPFVRVGLNRVGSVLDTNFNGYLEHVTYLDDTFDDNLRASLASTFNWRISDGRFHWVLNDTMAESSIDLRSFRNPDNQQFTNSLSTGPDLILRLGGADRLIMGARYNDFYAEETDDDNDGWSASATWVRRPSAGQRYGLRVTTSSTEFDPGSLNADYDRHDAVFEFRHQRSSASTRDELSLDLGYSVVEFDEVARDDHDGPAIRVTWQRREQDGQSIRVSAAREIGDIGTDLNRVVEAERPAVIFPTAVTGDPFTRTGIELEWSKQWQRLSLQAAGYYSELNYDSEDLDQDLVRARLGLGYQLRPLVYLQAAVDWSNQDFTDVDQDDETVEAFARVTYQRTRHWFYALSAFWSDRSSSNAAFDADNSGVSLEIEYRR